MFSISTFPHPGVFYPHFSSPQCFLSPDKAENGEPYQRRRGVGSPLAEDPPAFPAPRDGAALAGSSSWRRITLMILAITIHNIPEGLAVGVGFGAVGKSASATFQSARRKVWECADRPWLADWSRKRESGAELSWNQLDFSGNPCLDDFLSSRNHSSVFPAGGMDVPCTPLADSSGCQSWFCSG
ncbi:zinc transporter ZIP11 isoform X2 [Cyanistes caeruleus]|uniref:zinc transporter ZIP11 isoform X2 n=1 Tax=Cyanistes caeruleus TaxID=156563 RepID=UPI000CDAF488|nr:zinc transporter ZIP11 isoform X2 [Cyanistes caeruleus]